MKVLHLKNTSAPVTRSLVCVLAGLSAAGFSMTVSSDSFIEALTGGTPVMDARMRYEYVDQDNSLKAANGLTLRTRLGYGTGKFHGFDFFTEFSNTSALVDDFNSGPGGNGNTKYSVIADPDVTVVDQAYLGFSGIQKLDLRVGRQRIILDNARFVGNVGWRQNEQTFDAGLMKNTFLPDTTLTYSYLDQVNNIFDIGVDTQTHLANAHYEGFGFGTFTAYGYFMKFPDNKTASQKTIGLRFNGDTSLSEDTKLLYTAEYAKQSDYKDGDSDIDADYVHLMLGASTHGITAKLGYELLGADDFSGFETPLATKHAFNGWADIFLNTPVDGLQDIYVLVSGKVAGIKLVGVYHDFQADKGGDDYGSELDLLAVKKFGKHYSVGIKYAHYDADDFAVDTDKFWLWGGIKF